MIVGIDLRCLPTDGSPGAGVAHAARFLTQAMLKIVVPWKWRMYLPRGAAFDSASEIVETTDQCGQSLRRALQKYPCEVLFVPSGSVPFGLSVPAIPWVHDVAIFSHPEWFPQSFMRRSLTTWLFRRGMMRTPLVFAVSKDTKMTLQRQFSLDPKQCIVTHEGGDPELAALHGEALQSAKQFAKNRLSGAGIRDSFMLCLGTIEPRKNIPMLIQAWRHAWLACDSCPNLVIAGRDGWSFTDVYATLDQLSADQRSHIQRVHEVSDEMKRDLLLAAELVVVPSLYEGFGLVALEAMQAGTPVMASDAGATSEIVGQNVVLVESTAMETWSSEIIRVLNNQELRVNLGHAGKSQSVRFSWSYAAECVVDGLKGRIAI